jgi:uncharacterized membrane protein
MNEKTEIQVTSSQSLMYSGPLPTSAEFRGYEDTLPGAAARILALTEKEVEHRHKNEDTELKIKSRGQIFALVISLISLGTVLASILLSKPVASIAPAIIAFTGLASIFFNRKN